MKSRAKKILIIILMILAVCCLPAVLYPLFLVCCGALDLLGQMVGMEYEEICVVVNIYIQGALWMLSALLPLIAAIKALCAKRSFARVVLLFGTMAYGALYVVAFIKLIGRYAPPLKSSYHLCVEDLVAQAAQLNTTYEVVNIAVFVIFFVLCILGNYLIFRAIKRKISMETFDLNTTPAEQYNLERFVKQQLNDYACALDEIRSGKKQSHWIWYIFPQLKGLGRSNFAQYYGIASRQEAEAYLSHPSLGQNLREITSALLCLEGKSALEILGHTDAMKVRSSMTLFDAISPNDIFAQVLDKYYEGSRCIATLTMIGA